MQLTYDEFTPKCINESRRVKISMYIKGCLLRKFRSYLRESYKLYHHIYANDRIGFNLQIKSVK